MDGLGQNSWEKAFAAYSLDAATGRLFRGLVHNINGAAQAFSMQTELLQMLFVQAGGLLTQVENASTLDEARELSRKLQGILERRAALVVHLEREVKVIREVMQRCSGLVENSASLPSPGLPFSLCEVVETELEFMNGDGFFKHKVKKELAFAADLPLLNGFLIETHQIIHVFIENAIQAMQANFAARQIVPCLRISATSSGNQILLAFNDNGEGIAPELQGQVFEPFFTTRPKQLGIGLWVASRLSDRFGGSIRYNSEPGQTVFTLAIPQPGGGDVAR